MTRTGGTIMIILGIIVAILVMLGLIYGPELYRTGESIVAPIMELTRLDEAVDQLNTELPFAPPDDGLANEERLLVFFEVRRQLIPHYEKWQATEKQVERSGTEDLETAGNVLGSVTDVFYAQIDTLRGLGMSQTEFQWYEFAVYDGWLDKVEAIDMSGSSLAVTTEISEITSSDLQFVDQLRQQHGSSPALTAVHQRLSQRLEQLGNPAAPEIDGVLPENSALFWQHREAIAELKLDEHNDMHSRLRGGSDNVNININRPKGADDGQQ